MAPTLNDGTHCGLALGVLRNFWNRATPVRHLRLPDRLSSDNHESLLLSASYNVFLDDFAGFFLRSFITSQLFPVGQHLQAVTVNSTLKTLPDQR